MRIGDARSCRKSCDSRGEAVVDLRGTGYRLADAQTCEASCPSSCTSGEVCSETCGPWSSEGWYPKMQVTCEDDNQRCIVECGGGSGGCEIDLPYLQLEPMDPSPAPPAPPPAPPPNTWRTIVSLTASGDVADYTDDVRALAITMLADAINAANTDPDLDFREELVTLEVTPGSVTLLFTISDPDASSGEVRSTQIEAAVLRAIADAETGDGAALCCPEGFTLESTPVVGLAAPGQDSQEAVSGGGGGGGGVIAGVIAGILVILCVGYGLYKYGIPGQGKGGSSTGSGGGVSFQRSATPPQIVTPQPKPQPAPQPKPQPVVAPQQVSTSHRHRLSPY